MTATASLLDTTSDNFIECDGDMRRTMAQQIGRMSIFSISGGRVYPLKYGIELPVSSGMSVTVELDGNDTYVVRRLFTRKQAGVPKVWLHGERRNVYCDELSEVAYFAGMYKSYDADEWPHKA